MIKEQKKAAIVVALGEYHDNVAAVQESEIPGGFDPLVRTALVKTLGEKFERIFDERGTADATEIELPAATKVKTNEKPATRGTKKR